MADAAENQPDRARKRFLSPINVKRLAFFLLPLAFTLAYYAYFYVCLKRTIVVDAETGALEVVLEAELSGKAFRDVWSCERVDAGNDPATNPPDDIGCPSRTHHLVGPKRLMTPTLPSGTALKITSRPNILRIDVTSLPDRYLGTDIDRFRSGAIVLRGQRSLEAFGTMPLNGRIQIGALFSETDQLSVVSGRYQIRGYTPTGLLFREMRELREGALLAGARVRFVNRQEGTATGQVAVMLPDLDTALLRVTAISGHATSNLGVRYYFTEEVVIRPSFLDALILDPFFQLLATIFGAVAGYGWLRRLFPSGDRSTAP